MTVTRCGRRVPSGWKVWSAGSRWRGAALAALAALVAATAPVLAGCGSQSATAQPTYVHPASLASDPAAGGVRVVSLTPLAARRIGVRTTPALAAPVGGVGAPGEVVIPLEALVYDPQAATWAYTNPHPLAYLRVPVQVDHIDADLVVLRGGPPPGTPVVDVGAPELLGAEYGVGEE